MLTCFYFGAETSEPWREQETFVFSAARVCGESPNVCCAWRWWFCRVDCSTCTCTCGWALPGSSGSCMMASTLSSLSLPSSCPSGPWRSKGEGVFLARRLAGWPGWYWRWAKQLGKSGYFLSLDIKCNFDFSWLLRIVLKMIYFWFSINLYQKLKVWSGWAFC